MDLLILDEVHTTLSEKHREVFTGVSTSQLLGLTATLPGSEEYYGLLSQLCPVVFEYSVNEAQEIGAISDFAIYNLEVPFSRKDSAKYRLFDTNFKRAQLELGLLKRQYPELKNLTVFDIAKQYSKKDSTPDKILHKHSKDF